MSIEDEDVRNSILELAQITPALRYPNDDQTPITADEALRYGEAADEVYQWAIQIHG